MTRISFLVVSLASLGCSAANRASPDTAARPPANHRCLGGTRWLASDPYVPLALSKSGELLDVGSDCCAAFAPRGQRWRALDGWGRIVGVAVSAGGRTNEATQCYEIDLEVLEGARGAIYATPDFPGSPSFEWTPTRAEQDSLRELVAHADALLASVDGEPQAELPARARFFTAPPESSESAPAHFAVVGGRALLVGRLTVSGRWVVSYLDAAMAAAGFASSDAYLPIAILDMTGDGYPEIVFRENAGPTWADAVLHKSSATTVWEQAAVSPGGSTI